MIYDYDYINEDTDMPNIETQFVNAKTFLQVASKNTGDNLYDHLSDVINKILAERPENVIDFFEEYSRKVKEQRFKEANDRLEDIFIAPVRFSFAERFIYELRPFEVGEPSTIDPEYLDLANISESNLLKHLFYLEQVGLGLQRQEMVFLMLSMRNLVRTEPIGNIRFWGKIFGTIYNYLVLEAELKKDDNAKRNMPVPEEEWKPFDNIFPPQKEIFRQYDEISGEGELTSRILKRMPPIPQIQYLSTPQMESEPFDFGLNKKVYYVCRTVGDPWIRLPDVTSKQIVISRQICKSFTGNLEQLVPAYPEFPGTEKNYLRAQIARITSGTQIAPLGYYISEVEDVADDADEEEDEETNKETRDLEIKNGYKVNAKYDPPSIKDLKDPNMSFWVHTAPYILPQGRTENWNPTPDDGELGMEDDDDEEELDKGKYVKAEQGLPLLTPCSEDISPEGVAPWSVKIASGILDTYALAFVRSNLWPGAYAFFTKEKSFFNIYLGNGLKYSVDNFSPCPLPQIQQEYPIGPEIIEVLDPTGASEERWKSEHVKKELEIAEKAVEETETEDDEED
ncbi:radial spoke head protein 4 homolog A-like [Cylas formicarius]|uniref:radial spoke head protein 4 homolog A-like n=1 Tax=Cylas formicarius TaxID=197179 RepID=UPI0029589A8B|nr:radial spoke head protein 4 homolog A-like [Cylas formicarius]XP_060531490.1 radial spoke head protein 4 homolog A-like [Cylas formicarius]